MKKTLIFCLVILLAVTTGVSAKSFPKRNLTAVVVWGAGGGTDTCNRIIHAEMSKFLGVNVNVINKTGGVAGSVGMSYAYSKPHDGYTLCGLSESNVTAGVQGGWDKKFDVWDTFIVGGSPDVISVTPDTPYKTLKDLIEAAKKNPGSIKAAADELGTVSVTTNGILLGEQAQDLYDAGMRRINVSLDTLDPERFRRLTRHGDLDNVLASPGQYVASNSPSVIDLRFSPINLC